MIKTAIVVWLAAVLPITAIAQGQVQLANTDNMSTDPFATSHGLFWISTAGSPALINQDFNAAFYGGTDSSSLFLIGTFLLSDGSALHDSFAPGVFVDPTINGRPIQGAVVTAFIQIQAWTGSFNSYSAAISAGAPAAQSPIFVNPVGNPPNLAATLTGMPGIVLGVPEPSTFPLIGVGLSVLFWRFLNRRAA